MFQTVITYVSTVAAIGAALFAYYQAKRAGEAIRQASLLGLFGSFDRANEATLENPDLLRSVHGLAEDVDDEEAKRIVYLSILMDGFQHYYSQLYSDDFGKMEKELKKNSVFLNRILRVSANKERWERMKEIYYGDFDSDFLGAIDRLFRHEEKKGENKSGDGQ
jgi:hypothetical protein